MNQRHPRPRVGEGERRFHSAVAAPDHQHLLVGIRGRVIEGVGHLGKRLARHVECSRCPAAAHRDEHVLGREGVDGLRCTAARRDRDRVASVVSFEVEDFAVLLKVESKRLNRGAPGGDQVFGCRVLEGEGAGYRHVTRLCVQDLAAREGGERSEGPVTIEQAYRGPPLRQCCSSGASGWPCTDNDHIDVAVMRGDRGCDAFAHLVAVDQRGLDDRRIGEVASHPEVVLWGAPIIEDLRPISQPHPR